MSIFVAALLLVLAVAVIAAVIFMERGQRRIPIQHAKRLVGRRMYAGQSTHLPLKINTPGVIPPIFASVAAALSRHHRAVLRRPRLGRQRAEWINPGGPLYDVFYVGLIIFFCYFYTAVQFNPQDVADN
jgi:preprotein translocase subunit SecY